MSYQFPPTTPLPPVPGASPQAPPPGTEPVQPFRIGQLTTTATTDASWRDKASAAFQAAGANMADLQVAGFLALAEASSEAYDENPAQFDSDIAVWIAQLRSTGAIPTIAYEQAYGQSGFAGAVPITGAEIGAGRPAGGGPMTAAPDWMIAAPGQPIRQPQTEWLQYSSGVLVAPGEALGNTAAIFFPPGSSAPGSAAWFQEAQNWSPDKIAEQRQMLVKLGYLPATAKKGAWDVQLQNALQLYHTVRYQNGGKPMAWDQVSGAGGVEPYNFNQVQATIRDDIRGQFQRVFGDNPTDTELQEWQDFVIKTAGRLYKGGQMAPDSARIEAEQRFVERLEQTPEARFVTSNLEENTYMRDTLLRAVMVSEMMS